MADNKELFERFNSLDDSVCEAEAIALGQQGEAGLQSLKQLLATDNADLRFWAVRGLWTNGRSDALTLLIQTLDDEEEMVRSGAALALGELKAETAVNGLAHLLTTDRSVAGNHAGDALAKIGQPAAPILIKAMKHEQARVRRRAAKALIPIESKKAIPVLFEALEDESYMVRHYAEIALARMGVGQMVYFRV
jgi:HEAT repeat protein